MPSQIDIWRILPTQDGGSVFESDTIELKNDSIVGSLSDKYASNGVWFCTGKGGSPNYSPQILISRHIARTTSSAEKAGMLAGPRMQHLILFSLLLFSVSVHAVHCHHERRTRVPHN